MDNAIGTQLYVVQAQLFLYIIYHAAISHTVSLHSIS